MIMMTGPGFAVNVSSFLPSSLKDFPLNFCQVVPKCPPPDQQQFNPFPMAPMPPAPDAMPVGFTPGPGETHAAGPEPPVAGTGGTIEGADPNPSELAPVAAALRLSGPGAEDRPSESSQITLRNSQEAPSSKKQLVKDWQNIRRPIPRVQYGPRWCQYCKINKPDRCHHCRQCATCVLQYDREHLTQGAPDGSLTSRSLFVDRTVCWLGQPQGENHAGNLADRQHFVVFNLWAMLFCTYIVVISAVFMAITGVVDGQVIGLIAVYVPVHLSQADY